MRQEGVPKGIGAVFRQWRNKNSGSAEWNEAERQRHNLDLIPLDSLVFSALNFILDFSRGCVYSINMRTLSLRNWWKKQSRHSKRRLGQVAGTGMLVVLLAVFSVAFGDAVWQGPLASTREVTVLMPVAVAPTAVPALVEEALLLELVWIPWSGTRYHAIATCSRMQDAQEISLDEAVSQGLTACQRCNPPNPFKE